MEFDPRIAQAFARLPDYLGGHVLISATALGLGIAISLPLAFAAMNRPALRGSLLAVASIIQTIPGLALLALFYPLLLALAALCERLFGVGFSALGFLPSVLALTLYSMLPVLRNTVTGLDGIDPAIREAASGVGMTPRQSLWMVEVPLALPVIMAGIRTAAVWVIGTATLSTPIGQTSLGNYIFTGLQTQNWMFVLFGCVAAAVLALVVDQLLALMESGVGNRKWTRIVAAAIGLLLVVSIALVPGWSRAPSRVIIGAKTFTEQYILAALMDQRLKAAKLATARREGLGSSVIFDALVNGEIDAYVDYTGTLWAIQMKRKDVKPRADVLVDVGRWLRRTHGVTMLGSLGFENAYALAMKRERAEELGIRTIADLAAHARQLTIAGDYEFFARPEWTGIRDAYGLDFKDRKQMQAEFMYPAAAAGEVDVISAFSSDGRIAKYDLVVLEDSKHVIPPYDAILLIGPGRDKDRALIDALKSLIGAIDVTLMREANLRASDGGAQGSPSDVARWLGRQIKTDKKPAPSP